MIMSGNGNNAKRKNELLHDLEDYVANRKSDFDLVGDADIEKISSILGQSQNSNIIYVGKSGLGKTAAIYGIAKRKLQTINGQLNEGEKRLPLHMIDRRFLILDVNTLFEENDPEKIQQGIRKIFSELEKPGNHVLIIEDTNDWLKGIEDNQCQGLISTFVRELKKGAFQSILMVREEPGKNNLGQVMNAHSEMAELFTILEKKPPTKEQVIEIMRRSKAALESHHDGLHITDEANEEIVNLTYLYPNLRIYMREQPSRSLRMRDQIASIYVSRMQSRPKEMDSLEARLKEMNALGVSITEDQKQEREELLEKIDQINETWTKRAYDLGQAYLDKRQKEKDLLNLEDEHEKLMSALREKFRAEKQKEPSDSDLALIKTGEIKEIEKYIREVRKEVESANDKAKFLKGEHNDALTLGVSEIRDLFCEISGIPSKDLNKNEATKALGLDTRLKEKVYGQDDAVDTIAGAIKIAKAGLKNPNQPIGSFMLLGSSGLGKSYLAECLAEDLYDDKDSLTTFDMSEFAEKHTVSRLIGAPPGYAGYGEGGALTNAVRRRPYQVILLDEVEKAHPEVFKILLQVLDKGRLSDELGTVDFRNTLIIMTTNLAQKMSFDQHRTSDNSSDDIKGEVRKIFPQELLNRIDNFLLLKAHTPDNIQRMLKREIKTLNKQLEDKNIKIVLPDGDLPHLVEDRYKPEEGARQIIKFLKNKMTQPIADIVLHHSDGKKGGIIDVRYNSQLEKFDLNFQGSDHKPIAPPVIEENNAIETVFIPPSIRGSGTGAAVTTLRAAFAPVFH
jgi:ATP-dependent Clp protease ATP-binding subunit ClpB